ncbi:MAG: (d)CMP kinase [Candidatus Paceibacterota bacterium]
MDPHQIPIIAIDGTSSSGKGTIASLLAKHLSFHYLNSGALYRLSAHLGVINNIDLNDHTEENLNKILDIILSESAHIDFVDKQVLYRGQDIWPLLASQEAGNNAALISFYPPLRYALRDFQRGRIVLPGLVAEGRDMGTAVFPDAVAKIYLDASVEARAKRRLKDEEKRNSGKTYDMLCEELKKRDETDKGHAVGALKLAEDALYIDTSELTIEQVLEKCVAWCKEKGIEN